MTESDPTRDRPPTTLHRLHQRLLHSPNVINTQPIHRHADQPRAMATQLMRRLDLPSQIESRYLSRGSRSTFTPRFNGQRQEVMGLGSETMIQRVAFEVQRDGDRVSDRADSISPPMRSSSLSQEPAAPAIPSATSGTAFSVIQAEASSATDSAVRPTSGSDSTVAVPSGLFRISRHPTLSENANPPRGTAASASIEKRPALPSPPSQAETRATAQPSAAISARNSEGTAQPQIQAKIIPASTPAMPIQRSDRSPDLLLRSPASSEIASSITPGIRENPSHVTVGRVQPLEFPPLQKSGAAMLPPLIKVSSAAPPVQLKPISLPLPQKAGDTAQGTILRYPEHPEQTAPEQSAPKQSAPKQSVQESAAAIAPIPARPLYTPFVSPVIQRQEESTSSPEPRSSPDLRSPPASAPAPPAASPVTSEVDVAEIAEQVSRIMLRRMVVERERRGLDR